MTDAAKTVEAGICETCGGLIYSTHGVWRHVGEDKRINHEAILVAASRLTAVEEPAKPTEMRPSEESTCQHCHKTIWRCTDEAGLKFGWKHKNHAPSFYCMYPKTHAEPAAAPGDVREADEFARLLDLYVRGFKPTDVARDLVEKYRTANAGRDIFDANPAYTDAQLLGGVWEGVCEHIFAISCGRCHKMLTTDFIEQGGVRFCNGSHLMLYYEKGPIPLEASAPTSTKEPSAPVEPEGVELPKRNPQHYIDAVHGEGPLAYLWEDKPHQLLIDASKELLAALLEVAERDKEIMRMKALEPRYLSLSEAVGKPPHSSRAAEHYAADLVKRAEKAEAELSRLRGELASKNALLKEVFIVMSGQEGCNAPFDAERWSKCVDSVEIGLRGELKERG